MSRKFLKMERQKQNKKQVKNDTKVDKCCKKKIQKT